MNFSSSRAAKTSVSPAVRTRAAVKRYLRRGRRLLSSSRKISLILVYHRVAEPIADPWALCVSPDHLAEQMEILGRIADPVPLESLACAQSDRDLPDRPVAVTFDDGYADVLTNAAPILEDLDMPATVFVATGYLDMPGEVWSDELARLILLSDKDPRKLSLRLNLHPDLRAGFPGKDEGWVAWEPPGSLRQWLYCALYERLLEAAPDLRTEALEVVRAWSDRADDRTGEARFLTSDECLRLAAVRCVAIGAHTISHPVLARLTPEQQQREVAGSRQVLEMLTQKPVRTFAYPYGKKVHFNTATMLAVQSAGFHCGCANYGSPVGTSTNRWALPRYQILNWPAKTFAGAINQWFRD